MTTVRPADAGSFTRPAATTERAAERRASRILSLDIVRGVVMVLMAIDHVRLYGGVPTGGDAAHFLTRWVTHFCAPCFVFFAGTGAFFQGRNLGDRSSLSRFLVTRGLFLVVLELTVIRFFWTFNLDFKSFTLAGVIWMLGWCMVLMAALVRMSAKTVGIIGMAVILLQSLIHPLANALPTLGWFWRLIFLGGTVRLGDSGYALEVLYTIIPWIGIMAAGYGFGLIMARDEAERDRLCLQIGLSATALYLVIAIIMIVASPSKEGAPAWMRLLNQNKYRDSQLFVGMTLGPAIALLPLANRARGLVANVFGVFGRVPLFYYVLHILFIHVATLITFRFTNVGAQSSWFASAPYAQVPAAARWSLPELYVVWAVVVALLYYPCRWLAGVKARGGPAWLSYF